jgi:hypothetical protein
MSPDFLPEDKGRSIKKCSDFRDLRFLRLLENR